MADRPARYTLTLSEAERSTILQLIEGWRSRQEDAPAGGATGAGLAVRFRALERRLEGLPPDTEREPYTAQRHDFESLRGR